MRGCHNRAPFVKRRIVMDGAYLDGIEFRPKAKSITNFSAGKPCEYTKSELGRADAGCIGCQWKQEQKEIT